MPPPRRLIFRSFQCPGDITMLTAAVRDLHLANPGKFETDVRTSAEALWLHNPYLTRLNEGDPTVQQIDMHYPLIHECNQRPYHFIHGYPQYLEEQLGVRIPVSRFCGDIHLSLEERHAPPPGADLGVGAHFWIIVAGGKYDFTAKWWNPDSYQAVVDNFRGKIQFVQCGEAGHWHPPLEGVINLVGKTDTRELIRLVYHADGVLCPVTFAMHLAAAVETKPGRPKHRPCVVVAGGREPPHWEAYPHHQLISTVGALSCCADGGCWKSRCQPVGDGDPKDQHDVCVDPVQVRADLRIPRCMHLITPEQVIQRIELYYQGGVLRFPRSQPPPRSQALPRSQAPLGNAAAEALLRVDAVAPACALAAPDDAKRSFDTSRSQAELGNEGAELGNDKSEIQNPNSKIQRTDLPRSPEKSLAMNVLLKFRHGLGDSVQLTALLQHLQYYHPEWTIDVATQVGKLSIFRGLCRTVYDLDRELPAASQHQAVYDLEWPECHTVYADSPSTKAERCLREVFKLAPMSDFCTYRIETTEETRQLARQYFEQVCQVAPGDNGRYPVVLLHYEGNTSGDKKNIPVEIMRKLCEDIIEEGYIPVILDWDRRTPLADGVRIHNPEMLLELWKGTGTGDAESIAILTELSALMVGVDSGPLHVAGATTTPTIGVWTRHHPLHYFGHADNVTHLVPRNHAGLLRGDRVVGEAYFNAHYRYQLYDDLERGLRAVVRGRLQDPTGALVYTRNFWVRTDVAEQDLVVVQDIAEEDSYRIHEIPMHRPVVVDVGAHIGVFSKRLHQRNPLARIFAVECCPENIAALQKNVLGAATVIQGAMTYEPDVALLNAVYANCITTGGSTLISRAELERRVAAEKVAGTLRVPSPRSQAPLGNAAPEALLRVNERAAARPALDDPKQSFDTSRSQAELGNEKVGPQYLGEYWADFRPIRTLTLEDLMAEHEFDFIDILKLDCEGSEFSILGKTPSLDRIGLVIGEYHGKERFLNLVAERFAGWNLRILRDGELGTFWLTNPAYRVQGTGTGTANGKPNPRVTRPHRNGDSSLAVPTLDEFWQRLKGAFHPADLSELPGHLGYCRCLFELAQQWKPQRICEIGVRAGYSAFALLSANPEATFLGIDADGDECLVNTHNGRKGLWRHARQILEPFNFQMLLVDSHSIDRLPEMDLVYIDGDHSFRGCLADLRLAAKSTDRILVDDINSVPSVRQACDTFTTEHPEFQRTFIDNNLAGFLLFERRPIP